MLNKIKGSLIGITLGDPLGAPVEKLSHSEIKKNTGL